MSGRNLLDPGQTFPSFGLACVNLAEVEARVYAWVRGLGKPRARWNPCGIGYWTVRLARNGIIYQGVGVTLTEAYGAWVNIMEQHA
jgi:hypothetical protein